MVLVFEEKLKRLGLRLVKRKGKTAVIPIVKKRKKRRKVRRKFPAGFL